MKEWATHLKHWIRRHHVWSSVVLIVVLVGTGVGLNWTVNLVRFGLPPPTGQDCGSMVHREEVFRELTARADASIQVLTCFWHAYQSCQAATMSELSILIDAGGTTTVTTERRFDHCAVYGQDQEDINTETKNTTFLCNHLSKQTDTLYLSDCDGLAAFALVPRDIVRDSYSCGVVGSTQAYGGSPQEVESCFFAAYQQCGEDKMEADTLINEPHLVKVERDFMIENHCGIAYQRGSYAVSCANLEMHADGLRFLQCGTDGDLFVPSAVP